MKKKCKKCDGSGFVTKTKVVVEDCGDGLSVTKSYSIEVKCKKC